MKIFLSALLKKITRKAGASVQKDDPADKRYSQKYSIYHSQNKESDLKAGLAPYVEFFTGCHMVADIGCGPGLLMEMLRDRGISSHGLDIDKDMVDICEKKGLSARVADATAIKDYKNEFDGIYAGHIIEHMEGKAALQFLEDCARALKDGGILVIRTPNWENEFVRNGGFWLDATHVRPYPGELLRRIFLDLGFEIEKEGKENHPWQDIYICGRKKRL